jgi:hypothetical protein
MHLDVNQIVAVERKLTDVSVERITQRFRQSIESLSGTLNLGRWLG